MKYTIILITLFNSIFTAFTDLTNSVISLRETIDGAKSSIAQNANPQAKASPHNQISNPTVPDNTIKPKRLLWKYPVETPDDDNPQQCTKGEFLCDRSSVGFWKCDENGKWVYFDCAPGTKCVQKGDLILCDFSTPL